MGSPDPWDGRSPRDLTRVNVELSFRAGTGRASQDAKLELEGQQVLVLSDGRPLWPEDDLPEEQALLEGTAD